MFQRLSVSLKRFNYVLLHDTFVIDDVPDSSFDFNLFAFNPCELYTQGYKIMTIIMSSQSYLLQPVA